MQLHQIISLLYLVNLSACLQLIVNTGSKLIHTDSTVIVHNRTDNLVLYNNTLYYTLTVEYISTILQYDTDTKETVELVSNLLDVDGLDLLHNTLYILELGSTDVDPRPRVSAFSLITKKLKILVQLSTDQSPRSLFIDKETGFLYYGISESDQIMRYDLLTSRATCIASQYNMWPTGIYYTDNTLYLYNGQACIVHDTAANKTLSVDNIAHWRVRVLNHRSIMIVQSVIWLNNSTVAITALNETVEIHVDSDQIDSILVVPIATAKHSLATAKHSLATANTSTCLACDVCLPAANNTLGCGCSYGEASPQAPYCKSVPDKFIVFTQSQSLSLLSLDSDIVSHLQINTNDWYMMGVVYDPRTQNVFWVETVFRETSSLDVATSRIMRLNLNSDMDPVIVHRVENRHIDSIGINSPDGLLYWLDSTAGVIVAAREDCQMSQCIKSMIVTDIARDAYQLVIIPSAGYMVYINNNYEIIRRELDGDNAAIILSSNLVTISSMTVHHPTKMVYISSALDQNIETLELRGSRRRTVYIQYRLFNPISIHFCGDDLVVLNDVERTIIKVNTTIATSTTLATSLRGLKSATSNDIEPTDICSVDNGNCEHFCFTLPNGYRCGCADGYILSSVDFSSCEDPPVLYVSMGGWIQRLYPFPTTRQRIDNVAHNPTAEIIALDHLWKKNYLVWLDAAANTISLSSLNTDTFSHINIVTQGLYKPTDVSVDWISNTIFWSDEVADSINVVSLDGSTRETLVRNALSPTSLVVNPRVGSLYWIGWTVAGAVIRSSAMDGRGVTTLIERLSVWPTDITVDVQTDRVVWVDARYRVVVSCNPEGNDIQYIVGTHWMHYPVSIATWYNHVYWADKHMAAVYIAEDRNAENVDLVASPLPFLTDLVLAHAEKQAETGACVESPCSHVCIPTSHTTWTCICPARMQLIADKKTCRVLPHQLIGIDRTPYLLSVGSPPARLSNQQLHNADKITVHYPHSIYWVDNVKSAIEMVHINGTGYRTVYQSTYQATDISMDWLAGNIYWTEADSRAVKCVRLDGKYHKIIALTKDVPMFVLLDPSKSMLFWVECGDSATLYGARASGEGTKPLLDLSSCPSSMDISIQSNTIYWADRGMLHQYKYDVKLQLPSKPLPTNTTQLVWLEDTLFVLSGNMLSSRDGRINIDVGDSTTFTSYSPLLAGYSQCDINNGGCTHFCFHVPGDRVECGCPALQVLLPDNLTCTRPRTQCLEGEFRCTSGECVPQSVLCDTHPDCVDKSDEKGCGWCKSYEFSCGRKCIPSTAVCDGVVDCDDGADENEAICSPCNNSGYTCKNSGLCLPGTMKCNGVKECAFGDDEKKCPKQGGTCGPIEWQCKDGTCIFAVWRCDGAKDCKDGDDEDNCLSCPAKLYKCGDGTCIESRRVCDKTVDCSNGADELDCPEVTCGKGKRRCDDNQCRPANRWCDRIPDCSDKSDEKRCNYTILSTMPTQGRQTDIAPVLTIIFGCLVMMVVVVCFLYKFNLLPKLKSSYKQLTQSSNKTMETNVCVTTNTFSELDTCSSGYNGHWQMKLLHPYNNDTASSMSSILLPINTQINPYERFGIIPVQSTTDISVGDGPAPSVVSGGYSSGPAPSSRSHAPSSRALSRALSVRSRGARAPVAYKYHVNNMWDETINSISDYDQQSDTNMPDTCYAGYNDAPLGSPVTTDNEEED